MNPLAIAFAFLSALIALVSRSLMRRIAKERLGRAEGALLEIDFWRATKGDPLRRSIVAAELLAWAATAVLVAAQAGRILG